MKAIGYEDHGPRASVATELADASGAHTGAAKDVDIPPRWSALIAGIGLLLMAVLAPIANFGVLQKLIVTGDAAATTRNISAAGGLFRAGIASLLAVAILDVVVGWALYLLFRRDRSLSLLAAIFRIVYAVMLAIALNALVSALYLSGGGASLQALAPAQLQTQVMLSLGAFQSQWDLALIVFGLHLLVLGIVVFRHDKRLRLLGVMVTAASLGYMVDGLGKLLSPSYALTMAMFTFVGEVALMFWLLWRGVHGPARFRPGESRSSRGATADPSR
jgi:hypothetical protein